MFLHLSVILSRRGVCLRACLDTHPPRQASPGQTPPWQTSPGQTSPWQTSPGQTPPWQTPPGRHSPPRQTHPWTDTLPLADTPWADSPWQTSPYPLTLLSTDPPPFHYIPTLVPPPPNRQTHTHCRRPLR